jgi:hypothetical protein
VAAVRHLTTGFVSPQFHVVFDDHFHTIYGDGEGKFITDAICNLIWENDWDLYAEEEYGPDGSLIYTPPPLDKVWLDEEGLCEHPERLLDQCRQVKHQTQIKKQAVPIPQMMMLQDLLHIIQLFLRIHLLAMVMTTLMMLLHLIHQSYLNQMEMHGLIMMVPILVLFWIRVQLLHLQYLLVLRRM